MRRPLLIFFSLAFLLPWTVWGTTLAEQAGWLTWHLPSSLAFWIALPAASFGAAAITGGWPAVRDLLQRMIRVRVALRWWLVAIGLTPLLILVALLAGGLAGARASIEAMPLGAVAGSLALYWWMFLLSEETAWRGFALPRLQRLLPPVVADVVLGAIWAIWHLPLFFVAGSFQAGIPFPGFALSTIATSVLVGWVFRGAGGSTLIAALLHAVTDVSISGLGVMSGPAALFWIFVAVQAVTAVVVAAMQLRPSVQRREGSVLAGGEREPGHEGDPLLRRIESVDARGGGLVEGVPRGQHRRRAAVDLEER